VSHAFHITRAEYWWDSRDLPISREEWESVAGDYGPLHEDSVMGWKDIGPQKIYGVLGETASFSWRHGKIDIEGNYTERVDLVAQELAALLGAKVQSDDPP
jgi:hypothetical protein